MIIALLQRVFEDTVEFEVCRQSLSVNSTIWPLVFDFTVTLKGNGDSSTVIVVLRPES